MSSPARRAAIAVAAVFTASGLLFSSWASRIPQIRDLLGLSPAELGGLIVCLSLGSLVALPTSGLIIHRIGASRGVALGATGGAIGFSAVGIGVLVGVPVVAVGLVVTGFCVAVWDVSMNVEGASVEHRTGHPLMPRFHALFSLGTVVGALVGALMNALGVPVTAHLIGVAVAMAATCVVAARSFLPAEEPEEHRGGPALRRAWREPRTLLIGVFMLALSFSEGVGMDWLAVAAVDGFAAEAAVASVTYAVFVLGLMVTRWFGTPLLARFGRVLCLRTGVMAAMAGVLVVVGGGLAHAGLVALFAGSALWGVGVALGFPVGMSAAADDEQMAAPRVSVVSTIGYTAFIAGPTLIGLVGESTGVVRALLLVPAALVVAFMVAGSTRPIGPRALAAD